MDRTKLDYLSHECDIKKIIEEKLIKYQLQKLDELDKKTQERLIQIESVIERNNRKALFLIQDIKKLKLSKKSIADDKEVDLTRKTIYNNCLLQEYIEMSIEDEYDYFNEKRVSQLTLQLDELKDDYSKIITNIINTKMLELQIKSCNNEIDILCLENEKIRKKLLEKDNIIQKLKRSHNVINLENRK